jgi:hypothetical protein
MQSSSIARKFGIVVGPEMPVGGLRAEQRFACLSQALRPEQAADMIGAEWRPAVLF